MEILFTATSYPPSIGGAQQHGHAVAVRLRRRGHGVRVVTQWTDNRDDWVWGTTVGAPCARGVAEVDGVPVYRVPLRAWQRAAMLPAALLYHGPKEWTVPYLARFFTPAIADLARGVDLIHNLRIGREHLSWASWRAAQRLRRPFVITPNYIPQMGRGIPRFLLRMLARLLRSADGVFTYTEAEKALLVARGIAEVKVHVTGAAPALGGRADPEAFRRERGLRGPLVLFLAQKYGYKGFETLLRAAPAVWARHPDAAFAFIGPHYRDSGRRIQEAYPADPRIIDMPAVGEDLKASALAACDLLCLPSRQETFGMVFVEAWTYGKPVIGCDIPCVREVIDDGKDGFLVEQAPGPLAERMIWLLDHPAEARRMGEAGRAKAASRYTWESVGERVEAAYRQVVSGRSRG